MKPTNSILIIGFYLHVNKLLSHTIKPCVLWCFVKCTLLRHRHHPGYQFHHTLHRHPTPRRKTVVWEAHRRQLPPRQADSRVSSWPHSRKQLPCLLAGWIQSHRPLRDPDFRLLLPLLSDLFISQSLLSFVQSILFLLLLTFFLKQFPRPFFVTMCITLYNWP